MKKILIVVAILTLLASANTYPKINSQETEELKLIVLSADFSDAPHITEFKDIKNQLFSHEKQSLHQFFNLGSNGKVSVTSGSYGGLSWQRMPKPITYYAKDTEWGFDINCREMVAELMTKALDGGLDIDEYSKSWGGGYPCVCIVVSGEGENYRNYPKDDGFWPHASFVKMTYKEKDLAFRYILVVEGDSFNTGPSLVMAHEFGHLMGLADLYDYQCGGPFKGKCGYPFTYFDIMVARHGGLGLSGFHREQLGFMRGTDVWDSGEFELKPITTNESSSYIKLHVPGTPEYFGLEYRKKIGIDAFWHGIPCEGLLVYRVDDSIEYGHGFNDGDVYGKYAIEILNPGKTQWHEKATYSLESGNYIISAKTDPSTITFDQNYGKTIKIEVISKLGDTLKIKVTYSPRELIIHSTKRNWQTTGNLHGSKFTLKLANRSINQIKLTKLPENFTTNTDVINPKSYAIATVDLKYPEEKLKEMTCDYTLRYETENEIFTFRILLRNAYFVLDSDNSGEVTEDEIEKIFGKKTQDKKYDLDGDDKVDSKDLMIAQNYVGFKYK